MANKIGWCDLTINPITGCLNECPYCYARKMAHRLRGRFGYSEDEPFKPAFHQDKLDEIYNLHSPHKKVFLDSMGDWFSPGVERHWIQEILKAVTIQGDHTFLVLTKFPQRILDEIGGAYKVPENLWIGVSVTEQTDTWRIKELNRVCCHRFISFEPLHGPISTDLSKIHWVIIGAESGNRKDRIVPENEWAYQVVEGARMREIPIFVKDNFSKAGIHSKEFPKAMQ